MITFGIIVFLLTSNSSINSVIISYISELSFSIGKPREYKSKALTTIRLAVFFFASTILTSMRSFTNG